MNEDAASDRRSAVEADCGNTQRQHKGRCYRWCTKIGCKWVARLPQTWPRTFALVFGVVCPVFLLIAVSLFFGFFLAKLEAPLEIEANNEVIATRAGIAASTKFRGNVTVEIPRICLEIYVLNETKNGDLEAALEAQIDAIFINAPSTFNVTDEEISGIQNSNVQKLFHFMADCGEKAWHVAEKFTIRGDTVNINEIESLSFNWITCDGRRNSSTFNQLMGNYLRPPYSNRTKLRPDVQEALVVGEWRDDQRELFQQYFDQYIDEGMEPLDARILAQEQSWEDATGFDSCVPNSAAGAWFWFTVMTTIGYGNTAPATDGGRSMVFTLGFFSILTFAVVLGKAGHIVTTIFDDFVERTSLWYLSIPWVACIFWGACYYTWMVFIALHTKSWKEDRLGEEFDFSDAYWFSYISTTTVGFGDFFLEHEVLLRRDLSIFALWFLAGFVLLANFLVKLTELLTGLFPKKRRTLEETVNATPICWSRHRKEEETPQEAKKLDTEESSNALPQDAKPEASDKNNQEIVDTEGSSDEVENGAVATGIVADSPDTEIEVAPKEVENSAVTTTEAEPMKNNDGAVKTEGTVSDTSDTTSK